jgi:hypothetical protein
MTNGWRRFKWEDITKGQMPRFKYRRDSTFLSLSGQLMGVAKGQLSGTENLVLIIKQKDSASNLLICTQSKPTVVLMNPDYIFFDTLNELLQPQIKILNPGRSQVYEQQAANT